jgi:hypothetical protein
MISSMQILGQTVLATNYPFMNAYSFCIPHFRK